MTLVASDGRLDAVRSFVVEVFDRAPGTDMSGDDTIAEEVTT